MSDDKEIIETTTAPAVMTPASQILNRSQAIHKIMREAMRSGVDYGVIRGCGPKPTLLKPGAEKLLMMFQVAPKVTVLDLCTPDVYRYRVTVSLVSQAGVYLGDGIGEASTQEAKWHRPNPADMANTVLKMAKKRALVDAVLTVLGASDIFTQDVEDMADGTQQVDAAPAKGKDGDALTAAQLAWLERNAPLVWTAEDIEGWLAAHNAKAFADLHYGEAKELHRALVDAFEKRTKNEQ